MKYYNKLFLFFLLSWVSASAQTKQTSIPHLVKTGNFTELIVDDRPYLIFGGELGNSQASSTVYMKDIWPKLKALNVNTVFAPAYWELMEPKEGQFNYTLINDLIRDARINKVRLVILWFGAWKNSMSCYAPEWVKTDVARFPRAKDRNGVNQEILTPFSKNNLEADKKAFAKLLQHIKRVDGQQHTVIAVQVENEIGMLPDARTYDAQANAAFNAQVPMQLIAYLQKNKSALLPETDAAWKDKGYKTQGTWEEIFGKSLATDEIFMAYNYASFTGQLAAAGKAQYNLPMYVNAALNRPNVKPGAYPSAGPLPHLLDFWKAGGPQIDILSPDIYFPDYKHWADLYVRNGNPFFTPETLGGAEGAARTFFTFGNYNALSFSPFGIENAAKPAEDPMSKAYQVLRQLTPLITKYGKAGATRGFLVNKDSTTTITTLGNYKLTVKHDFTANRTPVAGDRTWPTGGALIIAISPDEFYVAGTGVVVTAEPLNATGNRAGIVRVDEGVFKNDVWVPGRRLNGDQDHQGRHVRIATGQYGIQRFKLYNY